MEFTTQYYDTCQAQDKIDLLLSRLNDELKTCHVDGLVVLPKINKQGLIELYYINVNRPNLTYRELLCGKLYSMILIRLKTRYLKFHNANGERLLPRLFYKIGKSIYPFLISVALRFSSIAIVDEFYVKNHLS